MNEPKNKFLSSIGATDNTGAGVFTFNKTFTFNIQPGIYDYIFFKRITLNVFAKDGATGAALQRFNDYSFVAQFYTGASSGDYLALINPAKMFSAITESKGFFLSDLIPYRQIDFDIRNNGSNGTQLNLSIDTTFRLVTPAGGINIQSLAVFEGLYI